MTTNLTSIFGSSAPKASTAQPLSSLASGVSEQVVTFIKSRPGAAILGFAFGYGAIWMIDGLREKYVQTNSSQSPSANCLSRRARFISSGHWSSNKPWQWHVSES